MVCQLFHLRTYLWNRGYIRYTDLSLGEIKGFVSFTLIILMSKATLLVKGWVERVEYFRELAFYAVILKVN